MTRAAWNDIALALADLRTKLLEHAGRSTRTKTLHLARIEGVDLAARSVCKALRARTSRFDSRRFMRAVTARAAK